MPRKKQLVLIVLAIVLTIAASAGTVLLLRGLNNKPSTNTNTNTVTQEEDTASAEDIFENLIDEQKNSAAKAMEDEAANLMESDPGAAQQKYLEAAEAYRDAGNVSKSSEMTANAMTAELLKQQSAQQQ